MKCLLLYQSAQPGAGHALHLLSCSMHPVYITGPPPLAPSAPHLEGAAQAAPALPRAQQLARPPQLQVALGHHKPVAVPLQHLGRERGRVRAIVSDRSEVRAGSGDTMPDSEVRNGDGSRGI